MHGVSRESSTRRFEMSTLITCYESRKAGLGFPACCKDKDCDEERKSKPIHACEMVKLEDGTWIDNFLHNGKVKPDCWPLLPTPENMASLGNQ